MTAKERPTSHIHAEAPHVPQDIWSGVFRHLATTLEPHDGLRGPGVVAADIVRAGMTCRDMHLGSRAGLEALALAVPIRVGAWPLPPGEPTGSVDWPHWERILTDPWTRPLPELHDAMRGLALPASSSAPTTKAELATALLAHFGLTGPCPVPARLWMALQQERYYTGPARLSVAAVVALRDLVEAGDEAAKSALEQPNLADARRALCEAYGGTAGLMAAHRRAVLRLMEVRRRGKQEEMKARREAAAEAGPTVAAVVVGREVGPRLADELEQYPSDLLLDGPWPPPAVEEGLLARRATHAVYGHAACVCGNPAAGKCGLVLCSGCCRAYRKQRCPRHGG